MRPNALVIFAVLVLAAAATLAVQMSPNFSSYTTGVKVLTADSSSYRRITIPVPYREAQRIIQPPVPEKDGGPVAGSRKGPGASTDHEEGGR